MTKKLESLFNRLEEKINKIISLMEQSTSWRPLGKYEEERKLTPEELRDASIINDEFKCETCTKQMIRIRGIGLRCVDCNRKEFNKNI